MNGQQTDGEERLGHLFSSEHASLEQSMEKLKQLVYQSRIMSAQTVEEFRLTIAQLVDSLQEHHRREEELLFVALTESLGYTAQPVQMMMEEHRQLVSQLSKLREETVCCQCVGRETTRLREVTTTLYRLLHDHFHKEEKLLFPMAEHVLDQAKKAAIMEAVKETGRGV
ncbi:MULTISPECIES: hemerythrin domain-containing protein [Brevibacillus]|jgi:Regulator of cell morphogenesis and NO signaling|uniref:hemerythrin domain-containing protein n=1 Tax=Brevibacillus TaxID=55080 RepID=UPI002473E88D|nr:MULTISPECIES: hemerythrin domain-containing protein [Brevibacillus]MDH6352106.1 hemerythrin-like domain-containing protein [Brevibacillus sp. 1238]